MIARIWRGWARSEADAELYAAFLRATFLPAAARLAGFRGGHVLRRATTGGEIEFTTVTRFESIDAVKLFAGEDYERANVAPRARELLARFEPRCAHHEVVISDEDVRPDP
ncbi:antibiotic biosynthesis monooxygenase family protein [uncultured Enterovirga sp.]|uniref:antibiotic biosynthesis monooxygenase family protein n=1 Tax=uncultured Enterovirga sp. TaxID=2026352 RepID=UPI0035CA4C8D